jgi:predicted amidohydrolase
MIKISAFQGRCSDSFDENLKKVYEVINKSGKEDSDFLCFPEGYLSNYKAEEKLTVPLHDPRLQGLISYTKNYDMVVIVGVSERESDKVYNTALVLYEGKMLGKYRKTMLTGGDKKIFAPDYSLPIFEAKGIPFGVIICHDSSFMEPALTMRWKGARLLFSPHYNSINYNAADEHRILVRNNHIGLSVLLQMVVVRANVVGGENERLGYGDSAIFSPLGVAVVSAPLFKEAIISTEFDDSVFKQESWRSRSEIHMEVRQQLWDAMLKGEVKG